MSGGSNLSAIVHRMSGELQEKDKVINQLQQVLRNQSAMIFQNGHKDHMVSLTCAVLASSTDISTQRAVMHAAEAMEELKEHYNRMADKQAQVPKEEATAKEGSDAS